jgi:integrase
MLHVSHAVVTWWSTGDRQYFRLRDRDMPTLTKQFIDKATFQAAPFWDDALSGFALRVGKNGVKSFIVRYRPKGTGRDGPKRFVTIGRYGPLTPA